MIGRIVMKGIKKLIVLLATLAIMLSCTVAASAESPYFFSSPATLSTKNGITYLSEYQPEGQLGTSGYCGPAALESMLDCLGCIGPVKNQYVIQTFCDGPISLIFNSGTTPESRTNYINKVQLVHKYQCVKVKRINKDGKTFSSYNRITRAQAEDVIYHDIINAHVPVGISVYFTGPTSGWAPYEKVNVIGSHALVIYGISADRSRLLIGDSNPLTVNNLNVYNPLVKTGTCTYVITMDTLWRNLTSIIY